MIGQAGSFFTTGAQGPGTNFTAGLSRPTGLTVDLNGNLFVADVANNRILRFPKPFAQQGGQFPDLYLGQPNLNSKVANYSGSATVPTALGLNLAGSQAPTVNMVFDAAQNLWVTDGGNRRVLRYAAADIAAGGGSLRANLVIGQLDFDTVQPAVANATRTNAGAFSFPQGIAFDSAGRLYVADMTADSSLSRVLVFTPPFINNQTAARIMGITPGPTFPTQDAIDRTVMVGPAGIFFLPSAGRMGILDSFSHRILLFDTYEKWPDVATLFSPQAIDKIGQPDFHNRGANANTSAFLQAPTPATFFSPEAVVFSGTELFVADTRNNRVVVLPFTGSTFGPATRVLGQDNFTMSGINLVEGREFTFLSGSTADAGIALDETTDTPHLFVADPYNHRILGFKDSRKVQAGTKADIVLGQPDFNSNLCNVTGNPDALDRVHPLPADGGGRRSARQSVCRRPGQFTRFAFPGAIRDAGSAAEGGPGAWATELHLEGYGSERLHNVAALWTYPFHG